MLVLFGTNSMDRLSVASVLLLSLICLCVVGTKTVPWHVQRYTKITKITVYSIVYM